MSWLVRFRSPVSDGMFVYERVFKSKAVAEVFQTWLEDHDFGESELEESARKPGDNRVHEAAP